MKRIRIPRTIRKLDLPVSANPTDVYSIDAVDVWSLRVVGDDVEIRFSPQAPNTGQYQWDEWIPCRGGATTGFDNSDFEAFAHCQIRLAAGGASSVVDLTLHCKGGAA